MLLVIDVGNTNIVLGVYDGEKFIGSWRMTTALSRTSDETGLFIMQLFEHSKINCKDIKNAIISSVVPNINYSLTHAIRKYFNINPMIVESGMKTGINIKSDNPKEIGADRIVNMVAGYSIYGGPVVIIDYGTATTYDVVNEKGEYITCIIAPGIQVCAEAIYQRAAKLPKVEIKKPDTIIHKSTVGSLQAGIVFGKIGETKYIIDRLKNDLNYPDLKVVATGGLSRVIDDKYEIFDIYDPLLTLKGLKILYEKNKKPKK